MKITQLIALPACLLAGLLAASADEVPTASKVLHPVAFNAETKLRQELVQVALGREPADLILRGATVLDVFTLMWMEHQDIVIKGKRIAWVGPQATWSGTCDHVEDVTGLWAVPGFGEAHKHIESTMISPEWEAALVIPLGNTWTVEGSHEFSNVNGAHNVEFWLEARKHGSPLKIYPDLGSATPPSAFEIGGGNYAYREIAENIEKNPDVPGLDEVMDWPAVSNPSHPGYQRIWEIMQATRDKRSIIEGHGAGLRDADSINAFSAAGIQSDHETRVAKEAWDKLHHGVFLELRDDTLQLAVPYFLEQGLKDWSNVSWVTDDRNVMATLGSGTMDYHIRLAIKLGAPVEAAYAAGSYNTARHMHLDPWVGSIAPGRFADVVLLSDTKAVKIKSVYADGVLAASDGKYLLPVPKIDWPSWATDTVKIDHRLKAADFEIKAPAGKTEVTAAIQKPFYTSPDQVTDTLKAVDGVVQRDIPRNIIKVGIVDRYQGKGVLGTMFWTGLGPKTPNSAVATSVSHDLHEIAVFGSSDEAMALAVNTVADLHGGIVLVDNGKVTASLRLEIGGLMTCRPIPEAAANIEQLYNAADKMSWIANPGFPIGSIFSMITCSPNTWRLVVPYPGNPSGLVRLTDGKTMPVVW